MAEDRVQRRLAAILAADVVSYSRLMREDEEATLAQLKTHLPIQSVNMFKQGETDMADKGKKDKGKKEQQKKAKFNLKEKRKQKKEKQTRHILMKRNLDRSA